MGCCVFQSQKKWKMERKERTNAWRSVSESSRRGSMALVVVD